MTTLPANLTVVDSAGFDAAKSSPYGVDPYHRSISNHFQFGIDLSSTLTLALQPADSSVPKQFDTIRADAGLDSLCARIYHLKKLLYNRDVPPTVSQQVAVYLYKYSP